LEIIPCFRKIFLLFNHKFSSVQKIQAEEEFNVHQIIKMPARLKQLWQQVPAEPDVLENYLVPFRDWLGENAEKNDLILVQGDFGATYLMVNFAFEKGLIPVYATSVRNAVEKNLDDGNIKMEHIFSFCRFRQYGL